MIKSFFLKTFRTSTNFKFEATHVDQSSRWIFQLEEDFQNAHPWNILFMVEDWWLLFLWSILEFQCNSLIFISSWNILISFWKPEKQRSIRILNVMMTMISSRSLVFFRQLETVEDEWKRSQILCDVVGNKKKIEDPVSMLNASTAAQLSEGWRLQCGSLYEVSLVGMSGR